MIIGMVLGISLLILCIFVIIAMIGQWECRMRLAKILGSAMLILIVAGIFIPKEKPLKQTGQATNNQGTATNSVNEKPARPMPGDIASFYSDGGNFIPVAASKEALDRLTTLSVANDAIGIGQLMSAGLVWTVPNGTKCRVIDIGFLKYEVRIVGGKYADISCFVASDFVVKK